MSESFDRSRITTLRHVVASRAGESGLRGDRLDGFVVAVNELLTNAVRHGGGIGHVSVWCVADSVYCEVTDEGSGLGAIHPDKPPAGQAGGWGLYLVRELTDTFEIKTGPQGTAVRISSRTGD